MHHIVISDWERPIDDEDNCVFISVPSVLDKTAAPPGFGVLHAYLKGSVFPDVLAIPLSVDALAMVLLGGVETVSGAVLGAGVFRGLSIWLTASTDLSKLVLGLLIVVVAALVPRGLGGLPALLPRRHRR